MLVMGLVLGPSLMVISIMGILLYAEVSPLYNILWECTVVFYKYAVHTYNWRLNVHLSINTNTMHILRIGNCPRACGYKRGPTIGPILWHPNSKSKENQRC